MALDKLTKIDGGGISTTSNYRVGIITATKFIGPIEGTITSTDATFTGNVTIGGTLTYEDVTNVDSVGIITARDGINVSGGNVTIAKDLDIDGHTNLDNVSVAGVTTFSDDVKFTGNNYNVLWDKSDNSLKFDALAKIKLNDSFEFYHNTNGVLHNTSGTTYIYGSGSGAISLMAQAGSQNISCNPNGNTSLYYQNSQKLYTVSDGVYINDNLGIQDSIQHILDTNTKIRFPAADTITFETAGSERARFTKDGNLFVGSNVSQFYPYNSFTNDALFMVNGNLPTINGAGQATILTKAAFDASDRRALLSFGGNYSSAAQGSQTFLAGIGGEKENTTNSNFAGALMLYTRPHGGNETERLRISSTGNVGINQSSPRTTLDVSGYVYLGAGGQLQITGSAGAKGLQLAGADDGTNIIGTMGSSGEHLAFRTASNERMRLLVGGPHLLLGGSASVNEITEGSTHSGLVIGNTSMGNGGIAIINSTTGTGRIYFGDSVGGNAARNRGQINYYHNGDYMLFATAGSERLRIKSSGQVLIGTTDEGLATYGEELTLGSSDHAGMTIRSGTSHKGTVYFSDATSGTAEYIGSLQYDHSDNSMRFRINGTDTLFINSSNNLKVPDSSELQFGGSLNSGNGDLRLYHNGSNSYVHGMTGLLQMKNEGGNIDLMAWNSLLLRVNAGEMAIDCNHNGSVDLYYNNEIRARTDADGFYISRVNTFSNPNNTGSETQGAMIDLGGNIHFKEIHPVGAYTDRCDLVLNTNSGYGLGLSDKLRITAGGRIVIYSSVQPTYNKGWAPGNLVLANNNADLTVDFTQGILFTDNSNNQGDGGWMHAGIVCTGSTGYNGNMCFGTDGNSSANNNLTGLTEKMRLTYNGCLNIAGNYTQTSAPLSVTTNANDYGIRLLTGSNVIVLDMLNNDSSGNCEIRGYYNNNSGTRGEGFRLESNGNTFFSPAGSNRTVSISNAEFQVNNNELQITSSASYATHINYQDNGSHYISVANSGAVNFRNSSSGGTLMRIMGSGGIGGGTSTTNIYNPSDERLKENMVELTDGLDKIKKLKPYSFTWKKGFDENLDGVTHYGFGAHQAKTVDEILVEKFIESDIELDGETIKDTLRVNEKHVLPLLVKAIQEQQEQIEILKSEVAALKGS